MCQVITRNSNDKTVWQDLSQEVAIEVYKMEDLNDRLKESERKTMSYIYSIAYRMYFLQGSKYNRTHNNTFFNAKEKRWSSFNTTEIEEYRDQVAFSQEEDFSHIFDGLKEIDYIWIYEYMKRNCSVNKLCQDSGINQRTAKENLDKIFKKIRQAC